MKKQIIALLFAVALLGQWAVSAQESRNLDRVVAAVHPPPQRPSVFIEWLGYLWPGQWSFDFGGRTVNRRSGNCE